MEQDAVLEANAAFYAAFNARDVDRMEDLWARHARAACIHPGANALAGRDAVMESWGMILSNPAQPRITSGGETATVIGDVAFVVCRELVAGTPLIATNVFVREDGEWRI